MILGIGSDLIDIRRVAKVIERHGDRFLDRIFTDAERAKAERRAHRIGPLPSPSVAKGRDVIDVHSKAQRWNCHAETRRMDRDQKR